MEKEKIENPNWEELRTFLEGVIAEDKQVQVTVGRKNGRMWVEWPGKYYEVDDSKHSENSHISFEIHSNGEHS